MQHYLDDAEFLNKEIPNYGWMKVLFGAPPKGRPVTSSYADSVKRAIADDNSDDDFMPFKRDPVRSKAKSCGSSKAVVEENSDDDFM